MENVGILKDSLMVESLLEILMKTRSQEFNKLTDVHFATNVKYCESVSMTFSCVSLVNNFKEKKLFPAQMIKYRFELILARYYWDCSTIGNLRCLNFAASEIIL